MKLGCAHRGSGFAAMGLGFAHRGFAAMGLGFAHCGSVFFFFLVVGFAHSHALQRWWCRQWFVVEVCVHSGCWYVV